MRAKVPSFTSVIVIIIALNHSFMGSATLQRFAEFALLRHDRLVINCPGTFKGHIFLFISDFSLETFIFLPFMPSQHSERVHRSDQGDGPFFSAIRFSQTFSKAF